MAGFVLRRSATLLLTLLAASLLVFGLLELLPGNAAQALMGPDAAPEAVIEGAAPEDPIVSAPPPAAQQEPQE